MKTKRKAKVVPKKTSKTAQKGRVTADPKLPALKASSRVHRVGDRKKKSSATELLAKVPRQGNISLEKLADKIEWPVERVLRTATMLQKYGYVQSH